MPILHHTHHDPAQTVLTAEQAARLLDALPPLPRAMVGVAFATGIRRGELFALRWHHLDTKRGVLTIREAIYDGHVDTPKTRASVRDLPLSPHALRLLAHW